MKTEQLDLGARAVVGVAGGVWKYYLKPEIKAERLLAAGAVIYLGAKMIQAVRD